MAYKILDVSAHQPSIDWKRVKADGVEAVWVKATEGFTYTSPLYAAQIAGAKKAGLRVGAYHYARPDSHPFDPEGEARNFAKVIGAPGWRDLRPVLDFETASRQLTPAQHASWARAFNQELKARIGVLPVFYSYSAFITKYLAGLDRPIGAALWLANYGPNNGVDFPAPVPAPWKKIHAHQYTSNGVVKGIPTRVDLSSAKSLRPLLAHPVLGLL